MKPSFIQDQIQKLRWVGCLEKFHVYEIHVMNVHYI